MSNRQVEQANRRVVTKALVVVLAMFGFGFALVPLYNVFCEITGINAEARQTDTATAAAMQVDTSRLVTVEFVANVNDNLPWEFRPVVRKMQVHPGELRDISYFARNRADRTIVGQANYSMTPPGANQYFSKTECFCFTRQAFESGEGREMPVRFVLDPRLPKHINTVTLSYTFFELKDDNVASAAGSGAGRL